MTTLLLSPRFTDDSRRLRLAAFERGWKAERAAGWKLPELVDLPVVPYGEVTFVALAKQELNLEIVEPPDDFLLKQPGRYLQREIEFTTVENVRARQSAFFAKPPNWKSFKAGVFENGAAIPETLEPDHPILVSSIVVFEVEYRAFVADRVIHAISPYVRQGALATNEAGVWVRQDGEQEAAFEFLQAFLDDSKSDVPCAVVIDVGKTDDGWVLVEANPAAESGLCDCELDGVLTVLERTVEKTN